MKSKALSEWDKSGWKCQLPLETVFAPNTMIGWVCSGVIEKGKEEELINSFAHCDFENFLGGRGFGPGMHYVLAGTSSKDLSRGVMALIRAGNTLWDDDDVVAIKELPRVPDIVHISLSVAAEAEVGKVLRKASFFRSLIGVIAEQFGLRRRKGADDDS